MNCKKVFIYLLFLVSLLLVACSNKESESKISKSNDITIKQFSMEDLKKELKMGDKQILIINFWATWCGTCREEMPDLIEFYDKFKDKVKLLGLSLDESPDEVKNFIKLSKINFPIYLSTQKLAQHLMVNGIPVTYIFKNGKYVKYHIGQYHYSDLKDDIEKLLNEK